MGWSNVEPVNIEKKHWLYITAIPKYDKKIIWISYVYEYLLKSFKAPQEAVFESVSCI